MCLFFKQNKFFAYFLNNILEFLKKYPYILKNAVSIYFSFIYELLHEVLFVKGDFMKLIIAVIKPFKLEEVRDALKDIGIQGLMVSEVKGYGRQDGHSEVYRGAEYTVSFVPKLKLEIVVADKDASKTVETISDVAKTGKIGDGKIFVTPVESALRIRTDEKNDDAI